MEHLGKTLAGPICLVIALRGVALLLGTDPWVIAKATGICVPIVAYVAFAIFTVLWAIKTGEIGVKQETTLQGKLYFWHGVSVVLTIVLAAAGSFVVLFASLIGGLLSGLSR